MPRRPDVRAIRKHRNYTVEEVASALGVAKGTVRRWLKAGLPALTDRRPTLILGTDLIEHLNATRPRRQVCVIEQAYCFSCRAPRGPALDEVEIVAAKGGSGRFFAICEVCGTAMHKSFSIARLPELRARVTVSGGPDLERISERALALQYVHFD